MHARSGALGTLSARVSDKELEEYKATWESARRDMATTTACRYSSMPVCGGAVRLSGFSHQKTLATESSTLLLHQRPMQVHHDHPWSFVVMANCRLPGRTQAS
ncbi:hypothetical protein E4U54_002826 [Claviceps lovelessii]|nr:hypothetical protein E4U54_002826 [Claviceps lovelessii]